MIEVHGIICSDFLSLHIQSISGRRCRLGIYGKCIEMRVVYENNNNNTSWSSSFSRCWFIRAHFCLLSLILLLLLPFSLSQTNVVFNNSFYILMDSLRWVAVVVVIIVVVVSSSVFAHTNTHTQIDTLAS